MSESIRSCNMTNNNINNIKCNYYFVFNYIYSLLLQSPKLDVIFMNTIFLLFRTSITFLCD